MNKQKFKRIAKQILTFEVDNRALAATGSQYISRKDFWEKVYLSRENEEEEFSEFLKSDANIFFITGHVGIGKSTICRYQFDKAENCIGLIIDMRGKTAKFKSIDNPFEMKDKLSDIINGIIKDEYLQQILTDIKYSIFKSDKYPNEFPAPEKSNLEFATISNDITLVIKAKKRLAVEALMRIHDMKELSHILADFGIPETNSAETYRNHVSTHIRTERAAIDIINLLEAEHLIYLYQSLSEDGIIPENRKSHLLVIDNIDRLSLMLINDILVDCLIELTHKVNRPANHPALLNNHTHLKAAIAVRDENISRIRIEGAAAEKTAQMTLGANDYVAFDEALHQKIGIDDKFVTATLRNRLNILKEVIEIEGDEESINYCKLFIQTIEDTWMTESGQGHFQVGSSLNLKDLCNESLRLVFDLVATSAFFIMEHLEEKNISHNEFFIPSKPNTQLLRGIIIQNLWVKESTRDLMIRFADNIKAEINGESCCFYRLILTYLNPEPRGKKVTGILSDFSLVFSINKSKLKEILFNLFQSNFKQGELITIYQINPIHAAEDIQDDALIRLNRKGIIFLENVLIQIDFFGKLSIKNASEVKVLRELDAKDSLFYLTEIHSIVEKQANQHVNIWIKQISLAIKKIYEGHPWHYYQNHFANREAFYLERVCMSHRLSIKAYIQDYIFNENSILTTKAIKNEIRQLNLLSLDIHSSSDVIADEQLEEALNSLDISTIHYIKGIWKIYNKYQEIQKLLYETRSNQ